LLKIERFSLDVEEKQFKILAVSRVWPLAISELASPIHGGETTVPFKEILDEAIASVLSHRITMLLFASSFSTRAERSQRADLGSGD